VPRLCGPRGGGTPARRLCRLRVRGVWTGRVEVVSVVCVVAEAGGEMLTIGSLFSGIGGLELGLERAGLGRVVWQCEQDAWCRQVLARHWPDAVRYDDVTTMGLDGEEVEHVDVLCGGFPCQDISTAGAGAGLDGARSGLFFELMRVVRLVRPWIVVLENVAALVARGLERVVGALVEAGYDVTWAVVSAASVGAPHLRERVFTSRRRS